MKQALRVYSIDGVTPVVHPSAYVHPSAVLIGDVVVGAGAYIGPCASLRGDFGALRIGAGANVQDCCVVHGFPDVETVIEDQGHIGHGAVVHGARIGRNALIGMNAVVNDYAEIGESAIVAALAFVKAQMRVPPRTLVAGIPARVVRELTAVELDWKKKGTRLYQHLAVRSNATVQSRAPLRRVPAKRAKFSLPEAFALSVHRKRGPR